MNEACYHCEKCWMELIIGASHFVEWVSVCTVSDEPINEHEDMKPTDCKYFVEVRK